jgi:hypothetical protein
MGFHFAGAAAAAAGGGGASGGMTFDAISWSDFVT